MRNIASTIAIAAMVFLWITQGFHWLYMFLLGAAVLFWEYPVRENIALLREIGRAHV